MIFNKKIFAVIFIASFLLQCSRSKELDLSEYKRSVAFYKSHDLESAETLLEHFLTLNPNFREARLLLGQVFYFQKKFERANVEFEYLINASSDDYLAILWSAKSLMHFENSDANRIRPILERYLNLVGPQIEVLYMMGKLEEQNGNLSGAIEYYRKSYEEGQKIVFPILSLEEIYRKADLKEKADQLNTAAYCLFPEKFDKFGLKQ